MCHGCEVETNAVLGRISCQRPLCEICAVVGDDAVWHDISAYDVGHKPDCSRIIQLLDRTSFYPLGKLVYGTRRCVMPPRAVLNGPTISRPQTANGHAIRIGFNADAG